MKLIGNRVLVEPEEITMIHGIHLPENITHRDNVFHDQRVGRIIAIGTGRLTKRGKIVPIENIKVGDRVILPSHDKTAVEYEGKHCWLVDADEILGVLNANG
jgi:co-chaperonin GroES (HSP10)